MPETFAHDWENIDGLAYCTRCGFWDGAAEARCKPKDAWLTGRIAELEAENARLRVQLIILARAYAARLPLIHHLIRDTNTTDEAVQAVLAWAAEKAKEQSDGR